MVLITLQDILSAVNTELKSATLLLLDDLPKTIGDFYTEYKSFKSSWQPAHDTFGSFCEHNFVPLGFAIKTRKNDAKAWQLSGLGKEYATPAAKLSLETAVKMHQSLYEILGSVNTPSGVTSPMNRIRILEALAESGKELREADIEKLTGITQANLATHLPALSEAKVIEYTFLKGKGHVIYDWIGTDSENLTSNKNLFSKRNVENVAKIIREKPSSYVSISRKLKRRKTPLSKYTIQQMLTYFKSQNYIAPVDFAVTKQSKAIINERGLRFVNEYVKPLRKFIDEDIALDICFKKNYVAYAIDLYKPHSRSRNQRLLEHYHDFLTVYEQDKKSLSPTDFSKNFSISQHSAIVCLNKLYQQGFLSKSQSGKSVYYQPHTVCD